MRGEKMPLFGGGDDLQTVADEIFGASEIPDSGRVVARPTPIMQIWRDPKQPRRAIPSTISMHSDGNPLEVVPMLQQWQLVAEQAAGMSFDVEQLLNGEGEGIDSDKFPSVAQEFISLVRLAQGIKADGLINPITIIESDGNLLIESGERRWLAFHLLNAYLGDQWAKIPAAKGNGSDSVWRQASENTQRRALNPIGMARQIALLIMAARGTPPIAEGSPYLEYEEVVKAGGSDRRYYAQVADGNVHRIPKGMGERIEAAMGLSMEQISQYRRLLRLTSDEQVNDALWTRADVENWPERVMRDISTLTVVKVSEVLNRPNWTLDDLKALKEVPVPKPFDYPPPPAAQTVVPRRPVTSEWMNKRVMTKSNQIGTVVDVDGDLIKVLMPNGQKQFFPFGELTLMPDRPSPAPNTPSPQAQPKAVIELWDLVKTRAGSIGPVVRISGRELIIRVPGRGDLRQNIEDVTLVGKGTAPKSDDDFDFPFMIGSQVVTKFGRVLLVAGFKNGGAGTLVHSDPKESPWMIPTAELTAYKEPVIDEDDIEEDFDPEAPVQPREWREGWAEDIGGSTPMGSDKKDSVEPKDIFAYNSDEYGFLDGLSDAVDSINNEELRQTFQFLANLDDIEAKNLQQEGQLKSHLDEAYDQIKAAMDEWLQVQIPAILQKIIDVAVS